MLHALPRLMKSFLMSQFSYYPLIKMFHSRDMENRISRLYGTEAAMQRCSYENMFRKYAGNSQENTHAEV